jgi:FtsH-binding integral membrane protein
MICGGERGSQFSTDDYIMAAMILYIDIIRMFLEILRLFGSRN